MYRRHARSTLALALASSLAVACRHSRGDPKPVADTTPRSTHSVATPSAMATSSAPTAETLPPRLLESSGSSACNEQAPQAFLVDAHYNGRSLATADARRDWKAAVARSVRYRTEQYGYYSGFGNRAWNDKLLASQIRTAKFFGLTVRLHERVLPALSCVEEALHRECSASPYQPRALSGIRQSNTYFDGDVSNHMYGIALDIDPIQNPCCNCIEPWRSSPRCQGKKTDFERMDMPQCWIAVFERFGFYWLGHDALKDTMHFEFLGDPSRVKKDTLQPDSTGSGH